MYFALFLLKWIENDSFLKMSISFPSEKSQTEIQIKIIQVTNFSMEMRSYFMLGSLVLWYDGALGQ